MTLLSPSRLRPWLAAGLLCTLSPLASATPQHWAAEIDAYTKADAAHPPARDAVVFIGSSSIRMWTTLAEDFPGISVIGRGFGGSDLTDSAFYVDRIAIAYHPRIIVLYAGDNDLKAGRTPEQVVGDFKVFCGKIHAALPATRVVCIAIKPSPSRWNLREKIVRANELIAAECAADKRRTFVDIYPLMLDAKGLPRPELFREDMLHMKHDGYAIWAKAVAPFLKP